MVNTDIETNIQGYDIDGEIIRAARDNAKRAGVDHLIHFQQEIGQRIKEPEKIWLCYYKSTIRRTSGREGSAAKTVS